MFRNMILQVYIMRAKVTTHIMNIRRDFSSCTLVIQSINQLIRISMFYAPSFRYPCIHVEFHLLVFYALVSPV